MHLFLCAIITLSEILFSNVKQEKDTDSTQNIDILFLLVWISAQTKSWLKAKYKERFCEGLSSPGRSINEAPQGWDSSFPAFN